MTDEEVRADLLWLVEHPDGSLDSKYCKIGRCLRLIEVAIAEIRRLRAASAGQPDVPFTVQLGEEAVLLDEHGQTLGQKLLKYSGKAVGLPPDAADRVRRLGETPPGEGSQDEGPILYDRLKPIIGIAENLPPDAAASPDKTRKRD